VRNRERTGQNSIGKTEGEALMEMGMVWMCPIKKTEAPSLKSKQPIEPETEAENDGCIFY